MIIVASSRRDLAEFPGGVRDEIGHALYVAQRGDEPPTAVRRGQGQLPSELTAQTTSPYVPSVLPPSRSGRVVELFGALAVGFVTAAVLAWLW